MANLETSPNIYIFGYIYGQLGKGRAGRVSRFTLCSLDNFSKKKKGRFFKNSISVDNAKDNNFFQVTTEPVRLIRVIR